MNRKRCTTELRRLGMSMVTVTDHDSIDAAEVLRRYPDFFLERRGHGAHAERDRDAPGRVRYHGARPSGDSAAAKRFHRRW